MELFAAFSSIDPSAVLSALPTLVSRSPLIVAQLVGIGLAVWRWKRHPKVSALALIGFGLLLFNTVVITLLTMIIASQANQASVTQSEITTAIGIVSAVGMIVGTAGISFIVAAIFAGRPVAAQGNLSG